MKKLIYAEDLKKEIEAWGYGLTYKDCLNEIEKSPTVGAIPIEWIKNWISKEPLGMGSLIDPEYTIEALLYWWEEENGCI